MDETRLIRKINIYFYVFIFSIVVIFGYELRNKNIEIANLEAVNIAKYVKDGLTSHMVNNIMDQREFFINSIQNSDSISNLWISRSKKLNNQFKPKDIKKIESIRDNIDKEVLKKGKKISHVNEDYKKVSIRVTIPYKASTYYNPNCMACHEANEGDILGAISIEKDMTSYRQSDLFILFKLFLVMLIIKFVILYIIKKYLIPNKNILLGFKRIINKTYNGHYDNRFEFRKSDNLSSEKIDIINDMNKLIEKFDNSLTNIQQNLSHFTFNNYTCSNDKLLFIENVLSEMSGIYQYKKTIESDKDVTDVYQRLSNILIEKFKINNFIIYQSNTTKDIRKVIINHNINNIKPNMLNSTSNNCIITKNINYECRALRTQKEVFSDDFTNLCDKCTCKCNYICVPYLIDNEHYVTIKIEIEEKDEYKRIKNLIPFIKKYLEETKHILESKLLMNILRDNSMTDALTGLYNRKYLENYLDHIDENTKITFCMIDIDFFKKVNDTYGHDIGDIVIYTLSNIIKENIEENDFCIRYGGEEFLLVLSDNRKKSIENILKIIQGTFNKEIFSGNGENFNKTLSIGYSSYPKDNNKIWQVIKNSDIALYKAKESGRNKIIKYEK